MLLTMEIKRSSEKMYNSALEIVKQTILDTLPVAILIVDKKGLVRYYNQEADKLFSPGFLDSANMTKLSGDLNEQDFHQAIDKLNHNSPGVKLNISFKHDLKHYSFQLKMIINPEENFYEDSFEDTDTEKNGLYLITLNPVDGKPLANKKPLANNEPLADNEPAANKKPSGYKEPSAYKEPLAYKELLNHDISPHARKNSQLKKNFKELKQFSRLSAMREISSSLADKLNQPLTAIMSYTQAMQRLYQNNASSDEINNAMERVVVNAENAGQIIKNIRAQLNVNTLNYQNICMNHLIQESIHLTELGSTELESTELDSPASLIKFVTHYEPAFITLCIDKVQIRQVIFSLVNNAIDAVMESSVKSPEITLTTRCSGSHADLHSGLHSGLHYEIVISDNGPGFPEEIKNKLFEPFTTTKKNGVGIGLSMCHHIIDLHKGSISIISDNSANKNRPDTKHSTVVTICLPLSSDEIKHCL